ncbi:MAG: ABC transporter permease subunit [Planctomycetes bacterium]|nr:ABC transporter permease subunit [Planctomycetota bacterium]
MNDIITIAQSTFYRVARMKALYLILIICVLDVYAMSTYGELSLGLQDQLMVDCALALMLVVGLITSMVAAFEIPRELRDRTAQFILSKPMGRSAFVWGKFLGVSALAIFNIAIILVGSIMAYKLAFGDFPTGIVAGGSLIAVEAVVLTAIGLFLSIFLTDSLAAIVLFVVFVVGHAIHMLPRMKPGALTDALYYVLPNFYNLDIKTEVSHGVDIPAAFVGLGALYGLCYALAVTGLAIVMFSRKDIS